MNYTVQLLNTGNVLKLTYKAKKLTKIEIKKGTFHDVQIRQIGGIIPPTEDKIAEFQKHFDGTIFYQKEEKTPSLYTQFLNAWFDFYERFVSVKPRFNATDGKALKEIIKYFQEVSQDDKEALLTWQVLLENWQKLDAFHQKNTDLKYINGNLNKIIQNAKQITSNGTKSKYSNDFKRKIFEALQPD